MDQIDLTGFWRYTTDTVLVPTDPIDTTHWGQIAVPNNWALNGLGEFDTLWFSTTFHMPPNEECSVWWVEFEGVNEFCEIWINEQSVGVHSGATTRFRFDVTPFVRLEKNTILLKVSCPHTTQPDGSDGRLLLEQVVNTGGIWGAVKLVAYDCEHPPERDSWYTAPRQSIIRVDPKTLAWWRGDAPFFPRGVTYTPNPFFSQLNAQDMEQDIHLMKGANVNIVRVEGGLLPEDFYSICDRLGLLVWQDLPQPDHHWEDCIRQIWGHLCIAAWGAHTQAQIVAAQKLDLERHVFEIKSLDVLSFDWWQEPSTPPETRIVMGYSAPALPSDDELSESIVHQALSHYPSMQHLGVSGDGSITELVTQTQQEQAQTVKYATEFYRRLKNKGIRGMFYHTFIDSVPAVSTSLIDAERDKKQGYYALKEAMQPMLPIATLPLENVPIIPSKKDIVVEVMILNDLPEKFANMTCKISMTGWVPSAESSDNQTFMHHWSHIFFNIDIPPCTQVTLGEVTIPALPPRALEYHLVLQLFELENEERSAVVNTYVLHVVR